LRYVIPMKRSNKQPIQTPDLEAARTADGKPAPIPSKEAKQLLELKGELEHADGKDRAQLQKQIDRASAKTEE
jgi:hypothetical protein